MAFRRRAGGAGPARADGNVRAVHTLSGRTVALLAGNALIGLAIGVVGTGIHRAVQPWGLLLALFTAFVGGVLARAWGDWSAMLALALGVATAVGVLGARGPGGDVLIAAQPVGYVWYCGALAVALAGLLPSRWFSDRPIRGSGPETTTGS